jgi:hypothetical protein
MSLMGGKLFAMSSYDAVDVVTESIRGAVTRAGLLGVRTLPESDEQLALDIISALEGAGYRIVRREDEGNQPE